MDKTFRWRTIGAIVAAIALICSIWWAGNNNGIQDMCNVLGAMGLPYCPGDPTAHLWWLALAAVSSIYLGFYITRARKFLRSGRQRPASPPPVPPDHASSSPAGRHHYLSGQSSRHG
jgi:drug/metabolite transporter (DMT)-like permease